MDGGIVGLLLAGGRSRRFGADKLMQQLPSGEPIVLASWRCLARSGVDRCVVLVPPKRPLLVRTLEASGATVRVCHDAPQGMGRTLACGIRAARAAAGWVVALADMPFVKAATAAQVVQRLRAGAAIVVPQYRGQRGHPVGFSACFADELTALEGDIGARRVLQAHARRIVELEVDDAGVLRDVDTPEDLADALRG